eukprot:3693298-Pleurochrysis_carterae.AAC.1
MNPYRHSCPHAPCARAVTFARRSKQSRTLPHVGAAHISAFHARVSTSASSNHPQPFAARRSAMPRLPRMLAVTARIFLFFPLATAINATTNATTNATITDIVTGNGHDVTSMLTDVRRIGLIASTEGDRAKYLRPGTVGDIACGIILAVVHIMSRNDSIVPQLGNLPPNLRWE